ncbi:TRAM domain-containing protein [Myxococcota bacterium]|nr:TRAM domain-containing protein [Myxococcota bacterium]
MGRLSDVWSGGEVLDVTIESLDEKWRGVGSLPDGTEVIIPAALPGDTVQARVESASAHKKRLYASLLSVGTPASCRVPSFCGVFPDCYGCPGATIDYEYQTRVKQQVLRSLFPSAGEFCPSITPLHYRSKTKWVGQMTPEGFILGGFRHQSREVVSLGDCPVTHPDIMALHGRIKKAASIFEPFDDKSGRGVFRSVFIKRNSQGEMIVTFVLTRVPSPQERSALQELMTQPNIAGVTVNIHTEITNVLTGPEEFVLFGQGHILERDHHVPYPVNATAFSQINHTMASTIYSRIRQWAGSKRMCILDLYAGNGPIALALSDLATRVIAVERSSMAVSMGNSLGSHVEFIQEDLGHGSEAAAIIRRLKPDLIMVNPPRSGLSPEVISMLNSGGSDTIGYMSCNPYTLKRDATLLKEHYTPVLIEGYDMFPHTPHFETLAFFQLHHRD